MSNTLLGLCYEHNVANPNKLGQAKFIHEANLAWETKWNMTAGHRNTTYGGDAPAEPIRFWTQNAAGKFKQIFWLPFYSVTPDIPISPSYQLNVTTPTLVIIHSFFVERQLQLSDVINN